MCSASNFSHPFWALKSALFIIWPLCACEWVLWHLIPLFFEEVFLTYYYVSTILLENAIGTTENKRFPIFVRVLVQGKEHPTTGRSFDTFKDS